jgi:hypothetical protein
LDQWFGVIGSYYFKELIANIRLSQQEKEEQCAEIVPNLGTQMMVLVLLVIMD